MGQQQQPRGRALKKKLRELLQYGSFEETIGEILSYPLRLAINPLFGFLLSTDSLLRWRAIRAMARVVDRIAQEEMESARIIIRRLMWQLNDESGGIGWGCPEAIGEILAVNRNLAEEFASLLISYIREDGNFLEHEPLQAGAVWAAGRLAQAWPDLAKDAESHLLAFLNSPVPEIRANTVWALGYVGTEDLKDQLLPFTRDSSIVELYRDDQIRPTSVGQLAREALVRICSPRAPYNEIGGGQQKGKIIP
ncbi:MAG: HEAT repeat domain-containing protein [Deltaproteobacteria bacterium]|nr:MAG: HEAT repeat domain-containing protein [Deltaproteobacteria bacterium]